MPKPHPCEDFDFPIRAQAFSYTCTMKLVAGGTFQQAMQEAIRKARDDADDEGKAALKDESCDPPCECFIFVDVSIRNITPFQDPKKKKIVFTVNGTWQAGVLCVKVKKNGDDKSVKKAGGESEGNFGGKPNGKRISGLKRKR